jgi:hypothetical protein
MTHHDPHVHEEVHHTEEVVSGHGHGHSAYFGGSMAWVVAMVLVVVFALIVIFALFAWV